MIESDHKFEELTTNKPTYKYTIKFENNRKLIDIHSNIGNIYAIS